MNHSCKLVKWQFSELMWHLEWTKYSGFVASSNLNSLQNWHTYLNILLSLIAYGRRMRTFWWRMCSALHVWTEEKKNKLQGCTHFISLFNIKFNEHMIALKTAHISIWILPCRIFSFRTSCACRKVCTQSF